MAADSHPSLHNHSRATLQVVLLAILFSVIGLKLLLICFICCRTRRNSIAPATSIATRPTTTTFSAATASTYTLRLSPQVISSLPTFVYTSEDDKEKKECSVCLMEFKDGDKGRFLPRCLHRFHAECVDRWFLTHCTCPLCRGNVFMEAEIAAEP